MALYTINKKNTCWRILDGEAVMINIETSFYYSLNKTGTFIWNLLGKGKIGFEEILRKVSAHYGKEEPEIKNDIKKVLDHLAKENLIEEKE